SADEGGELGAVRRGAGDADAADEMPASIYRDAAAIDGRLAAVRAVEQILLPRRDAEGRNRAAVEAGDGSADRAAARIRRPARQGHEAAASPGRSRQRARAIDRRTDRAVQRVVGIERAAAVDVVDSVERGVRRVPDARWKMYAADEADGARRQRRLVVAEEGGCARERYGDIRRLRRRRQACVNAENRAGAIDDGDRHRIGDGRRRRVDDGADVVARQSLRDA